MVPRRLHLSDRVVDLERSVVLVEERRFPLTQTEVAALRYLGERANRDVTREELERQVWGFRAGVRSEAVPVAMRRLRQKLEPHAGEATHLLTVAGVGWRLVAEVTGDAPPAPAAGLVPPPVWLDGFVERAPERALLGEALAAARLVTVVGPGGVGKTRLCAEVVRELARPVAFVALSEAASRSEAGLRVLGAVGHPGLDGAPEAVGAALDGAGPLLLLLDNAEHLDGLGGDVAEWLRVAPALSVLATSRRPLRVSGERLLPLAPLGEDAATRLFLERARAVDPWADLDSAAAREAVSRLVGLLDGLPLALELAATRLPVLDVRELLERADQHLALLHDDARGERQGTLERTLRWSWELLEPWARDTLVGLAAFEGRFDVADAEAVLSSDGAGPALVDRVQHLVEHSLVAVRHDARPRLALLGAARAFARSAGSPAVLEAARARHARRMARLGAPEALRRAEVDPRARDRLAAAVADLHAAAGWALAAGELDLAVANALAAAEARRLVGPASEGLALVRAVAAAVGPSVRLDLALAGLADRVGLGEEARAAADRALRSARTDEERVEALLTGAWLRQYATYTEVEALAGEGLALAQALGDRHRESGFLRLLLEGARVRGDLAGAEDLAARALALVLATQDESGEIRVLVNLGNVRAAGGDLHGALDALHQAVRLLRGSGQPVALARALVNTGIAHGRLGQWPASQALLEEALALGRRLADRRLEALCLANLGQLHVERGAPTDAEAPLRQAIRMAAAGRWRGIEHDARGSLAEVLARQGRLAAALAELDLAAAGMAEVGYRANELRILTRAAELWREAGDRAEARSRASRGFVLVEALGAAGQAWHARLAAVEAWASDGQ